MAQRVEEHFKFILHDRLIDNFALDDERQPKGFDAQKYHDSIGRRAVAVAKKLRVK